MQSARTWLFVVAGSKDLRQQQHSKVLELEHSKALVQVHNMVQVHTFWRPDELGIWQKNQHALACSMDRVRNKVPEQVHNKELEQVHSKELVP